MAQALKDAYADLFVLRSHPAESDRPILEGKFKSTHNVSDRLAKLMASTFYALLALADLNAAAPGTPPPPAPIRDDEPPPPDTPDEKDESPARHTRQAATNLHYNIQIHLPATKDEVFNAIFKSLKEHLLE